MEETKTSSDYCSNCGTPLLFPNKPCPACNKSNNGQISRQYINNNNSFPPSMVSSKENTYFYISLVVSVLLYILCVLSIVGITYIIEFAIFFFMVQGFFIGNIRGNAIKINQNQFPEIHDIAQVASVKLGLKKVPDIYVLQSGGLLNALATKFLDRDFVIIYSDVLELGYKQGIDALEFIICHEFAHIKRKHLEKHLLLLPSLFIPFLGSAYSRACEYTCDRIAAYLQPKGAVEGLLVLAAGKELYSKVNIKEFILSAQSESGFWSWVAEIYASHPHLYKRLKEVQVFLPND
ncbi:MAG: M48 family metallopeptidase [bacterium]